MVKEDTGPQSSDTQQASLDGPRMDNAEAEGKVIPARDLPETEARSPLREGHQTVQTPGGRKDTYVPRWQEWGWSPGQRVPEGSCDVVIFHRICLICGEQTLGAVSWGMKNR